ncbi:MAG: hypothetical protein ACKV1O_28705 [Saprospiraceae bacterium]
MGTNQNIEDMFFILRNKEYMLISTPVHYHSFVNFIAGYELGFCLSMGEPILSFNEWLMEKEEKRFSSNWPSYILEKNNGDEKDSKKMLVDYFEMYIKQVSSLNS